LRRQKRKVNPVQGGRKRTRRVETWCMRVGLFSFLFFFQGSFVCSRFIFLQYCPVRGGAYERSCEKNSCSSHKYCTVQEQKVDGHVLNNAFIAVYYHTFTLDIHWCVGYSTAAT
jgi:hypothetical protein